MIGLLFSLLALLAAPFSSKSQLEAENAAVRTENLIRRRLRFSKLNTVWLFQPFAGRGF
jgi:hypothetical protein